ncbi:MAG: alanine:cation symporter family protein [Oscillospiraceae bacterium]
MDFATQFVNGLTSAVGTINTWLKDVILDHFAGRTGICSLCGSRFVQVRKLKQGFKAVFGNIRLHGDQAGKDGMSSFQSLATAVAAQVGTGNIAGAATAIASAVQAPSSGCG